LRQHDWLETALALPEVRLLGWLAMSKIGNPRDTCGCPVCASDMAYIVPCQQKKLDKGGKP